MEFSPPVAFVTGPIFFGSGALVGRPPLAAAAARRAVPAGRWERPATAMVVAPDGGGGRGGDDGAATAAATASPVAASVAAAGGRAAPSPVSRRQWDASRPQAVPFSISALMAAYFTSAPAEYSPTELHVVAGAIPAGLVGTLLRNGPGKCHVNPDAVAPEEPYILPFDGDGMIHRFVFTPDGRAVYANAFVRTDGYVAELAAGRVLYRGTFGTQRPAGLRVPTPWGPVDMANAGDTTVKNTANTNVVAHGGKVLALWEGAPPVALDGRTLETLGPDSLGGLLATPPGAMVSTTGMRVLDRLLGMGADALCAHPRPAPVVGGGGARRMMAFGVKPLVGGGGSLSPSAFRVTIYEFDEGSWVPSTGEVPATVAAEPVTAEPVAAAKRAAVAGSPASSRRPPRAVTRDRSADASPPPGVTTVDVTSGGFTLVHDAIATNNYYVLVAPPLEMDVGAFLRGTATAGAAMSLAPHSEPTALYLVPRPGSAAAAAGVGTTVRYLVNGFAFHHANAYEAEGELVVDSFVAPDFLGSRLATADYSNVDYDAMRPTPLLRYRVPLPRMPGGGGSAPRPPLRPATAAAGMSKANPAAGEVLSRPGRSGDFPTIHPAVAGRPYRYAYHALSHMWGDGDEGPVRSYALGGLARTDVTGGGDDAEWWAGPSTIVGEPVFVARDTSRAAYAVPPRPPGAAEEVEGDGWVLSLCYDGTRRASVLHILEADDLAAGPVCTLQLPAVMPMTIHGTWTPDQLL